MPSSRIEFPLRKVKTHFGFILDPTIPVHLLTPHGFVPFDFLLDTGADATMVPRFIAKVTGLDLKKLPREKLFGIENASGVWGYRGKMTLRIGGHIFLATAFFAENDRCPLILGRSDFFDHFNITFDNQHSKVTLKPIH